jgi:8-oxo-dGTP pyrophosphatase MutT (NUDIX family)
VANAKGTYGRFACIPEDNTGGLLLVQRGNKADGSVDGRWNYPGGGVDETDVLRNATAEEIVTREVMEETGLQVKIADHRPVGEYPTADHSDVAITYLCTPVGGGLVKTDEGIDARFFNPDEIMELARIGDVEGGLVGGLRTSSGGVPRHIQMCLHFFTRACDNTTFRSQAEDYCDMLGIPR